MEKALRQQKNNIVKIVLFGPESTGKTTLSRQLAKHYKTVWAPEFAREYLQEKWDTESKICEPFDILPIAVGQIKSENEQATLANRLLICDTDLLETKVYSEVYFDGSVHPLLAKFSLENEYELYLLTYIDTPWKPDDLRDKPNEREEIFDIFESALKKQKRPYIILKGGKKARFQTAIKAIDTLLEDKKDVDGTSDSLSNPKK
jgi:NadR type nicotinamide-nucleotide adenylyltransferase|tara:strand:- start:591 stop:1202 length:612 start_codon:yes stop_codon:yes gene_type:complete